jgi:hypothetical protein
MNHRAILLSAFLSAFVTASAAQEPSGRIDLAVVSDSPFPRFVVVDVSFAQDDSQCPEDRGTLQISRGTLALLRPIPQEPRPTSGGRWTIQPTDDETQQYRIQTSACNMYISVRQLIRHEGSWEPLLVPRQQRPSLSPDERRELQRQFTENLRTPKEPTPSRREMMDRFTAAQKEIRAWGNGSGSFAGSVRLPLGFDEGPQTCFEALGDYHIERAGIRFSFVTGLPGDLNRFVIERTDPDAIRRRLYFTRGDCRFELTISRSVSRDGEWLSVPLAPIPPLLPPRLQRAL